MPPWGIVWLIVWSYVHSQMNPQTCTKFGANRSSRLTASPDFWMCDPLTLPDMPSGVLRGDLYLAYANSQMNPQTWTKVGANRSSRLTASPVFWMFDPLPPSPDMPSGVLRGELYLAYAHSQLSLQTWTKVGANRSSCLTASPDFWMFDPLKPPKCPLVYLRADVYQIWCQSVQSFDSLPRLLDLWPPKTPRNAPLCLDVQLVWHISIPRGICTCVPNLMSIGPAVW